LRPYAIAALDQAEQEAERQPIDHSRSPSTQPYRTTSAAQATARRLDRLYPCSTCRTGHDTQLEADLCCPANAITDIDHLARILGRRLGGL
jgi:hypothetical protein